nr:hypothetical protein BaRGS_033417 [Batillaria attramentaria]
MLQASPRLLRERQLARLEGPHGIATSEKSLGLEWSNLTRHRTIDVVVGLTIHCLLMAVYLLLAKCARVARTVALFFYAVVLRVATWLGVVRPVRLVRDTGKVKEQLEGATLVKGAGFNLVLFEDLGSS